MKTKKPTKKIKEKKSSSLFSRYKTSKLNCKLLFSFFMVTFYITHHQQPWWRDRVRPTSENGHMTMFTSHFKQEHQTKRTHSLVSE